MDFPPGIKHKCAGDELDDMPDIQTSSCPLDVPQSVREKYEKNLKEITQGTGRLMLFAGDQKIEHLNDDFFGPGISEDDADPEHLFRIASRGRIGVFAAQMGLISRYGMDYPGIPYLVKVNGKTHLIRTEEHDPISTAWYSVDDIVLFARESGLHIVAVGYTIYPGSLHEAVMLREAAALVRDAHRHGLVTVLWAYPRGHAVGDERDPHLIAGAAGVAACLGTDFVKVNSPKRAGVTGGFLLEEAVRAAGRTRVICAGGSATDPGEFLADLHRQIHEGGCAGNATGRNIHQKSLAEAVAMCNAIAAVTYDGVTVEEAYQKHLGGGTAP